MNLLDLKLEARGEIIASNLPEFLASAREAVAAINRDLHTDEDFGQAVADIKALKAAEDAVKAARVALLESAGDINAAAKALDEAAEIFRQPRLGLEKDVVRRTEEVKGQLVAEAIARIALPQREAAKHFAGKLEAAIKGKRTLATMETALNDAVDQIDRQLAETRYVLDEFRARHPDLQVAPGELAHLPAAEAEAHLARQLAAAEAFAKQQAMRTEAEAARKAAQAEAEEIRKELEQKVAKMAQAAPLTADEARGPKIGSIPTAGAERQPTQEEEWESFKAALFAALAEVKAVRAKLRHGLNQQRASMLAAKINAGWQEAAAYAGEEVAP